MNKVKKLKKKYIGSVSLDSDLQKACKVFENYMRPKTLTFDNIIPYWVLQDAEGIVFLQSWKVSYLGGLEMGHGFVMLRTSKHSWSSPCAINSYKVSVGAQAGFARTNHVLVLRNKKAVQTFLQGKQFRLGAELSCAVGPVGRNCSAQITATNKSNGTFTYANIWSYSKQKGLLLGRSLSGELITIADKVNDKYYVYDTEPTSLAILAGKVVKPFNTHFEMLLDLLDKYMHVAEIYEESKEKLKTNLKSLGKKNLENIEDYDNFAESTEIEKAENKYDEKKILKIKEKIITNGRMNDHSLEFYSDCDSSEGGI